MPTNTSHRILVVDIVRGFALMGLFLVHVIEYYELYWAHPEPGPIHDTVTFIFSGKAYSTFALMFGLTFYILLEGRDASRTYSAGRFLWRMTLLMLFGFLHSLVYPGDILQMLAVCGLFLLAVYRLPTSWLVVLAVLLLGQVVTIVQYLITLQDSDYTQPRFWALSGRNFEAYANYGLQEFLKHTATFGQIPKWVLIVETGGTWNLFGLVLTGLLIGRSGFFTKNHTAKQLWIYLSVAIVCAVVFRISNSAFAEYFPEPMPRWGFYVVMGGYFNLSMVAVYILGLMLLVRTTLARKILSPLAAYGRMSLTFYVGQSLVFIPVFYGFGLDLHQSIGQRNALLMGLAAVAVQVLFANWWFSRFRFGPLEWCWRTLTQLPFAAIPPARSAIPGELDTDRSPQKET